jgi:hypothetical protein
VTPESTYSLAEDPVIWYSGGQYHVVYDYPDDRVGYHLTSPDGIHDWTDEGLAYDPRLAQQIFSYTDSTVDHWYKMERPNVLIENGHVTHVTWAVSDVDKNDQIPAGSDHGSKVIVVPFDGVLFDYETGDGGVDDAGDGGVDDGGNDGGQPGNDGGTDGGAPDSGATGTGGTGGSSAPSSGASTPGGPGGSGGGGTASRSSGCSCSTIGAPPERTLLVPS